MVRSYSLLYVCLQHDKLDQEILRVEKHTLSIYSNETYGNNVATSRDLIPGIQPTVASFCQQREQLGSASLAVLHDVHYQAHDTFI